PRALGSAPPVATPVPASEGLPRSRRLAERSTFGGSEAGLALLSRSRLRSKSSPPLDSAAGAPGGAAGAGFFSSVPRSRLKSSPLPPLFSPRFMASVWSGDAGSFCDSVGRGAPRSRSTPVVLASLGGSSNEISGAGLATWLVPPRSKSSVGTAAAGPDGAAGNGDRSAAPGPPPYRLLRGSIERPSAAAFSHSRPTPLVRLLSLD